MEKELTRRELEVLRLAATGLTQKEMAKQLEISRETVKIHHGNIYDKLCPRLRRVVVATLWALATGQLELESLIAELKE